MDIQFNTTSVSSCELSSTEDLKFPSNEEEAKGYIQAFITKYDLPNDAEVTFETICLSWFLPSVNKITVIWKSPSSLEAFKDKYPVPFHQRDWLYTPIQKIKFEFFQDKSISLETVFFGKTGHSRKDPIAFIIQEGTVELASRGLDIQIIRSFKANDTYENQKRYGI